ncbi:glycosyl transferase group 1 [Halothece sp. PCC 7418]|uniref:glycosyltransferase family 4 protein n=1 Tax=Halothece sp. (strain PCC 7418) TaxID=65093 RepID=UPI0002A05DEA|nr:glycosyltransferase family 4 protein [Halothece sp. PCC 7418]AFZ45112.1 glycosyl transferase group 1 [Halothece sp. PCC 7418]
MRIAQIAPLWERVPPPAYGGIELVVGLLTEELVRRGHEVTLFATGDSQTSARLESVYPQAMRLDSKVNDYDIYNAIQLERVYSKADQFDIIHSHVDYSAFPYAQFTNKITPTLHTIHGSFTPEKVKLYHQFRQQHFVSISDAQRALKPDLNYAGTVYNAIDVSSHQYYPKPQDPPYLAFLGRMSPEKAPHYAIAIAKASAIPLKLAGKIDPIDESYFTEQVKPHIDGETIQFLGEVNHDQKNALLGGAIALLFPITWEEPFGLVMLEAMAAGTPVIAMRRGSTSEIVDHEQTGFLCDSLEECVAAVGRIPEINRGTCRESVAKNFGVARMTDGYEAVYRQLWRDQFVRNGHRTAEPTIALAN